MPEFRRWSCSYFLAIQLTIGRLSTFDNMSALRLDIGLGLEMWVTRPGGAPKSKASEPPSRVERTRRMRVEWRYSSGCTVDDELRKSAALTERGQDAQS